MKDEDKGLVKRWQEGDISAFEELVNKYKQKMYGIAYGIIQNREDAFDISQEAFLKAYCSIKRFKAKSSFYTWLYRIVVNLAIDFKRKRRLVRSLDRETLISTSSDEETIERKSLKEDIQKALSLLPPNLRAVVVLREIEGLSYKEIAEVLKCSRGTVMSRLHYARRKLRDLLRSYIF